MIWSAENWLVSPTVVECVGDLGNNSERFVATCTFFVTEPEGHPSDGDSVSSRLKMPCMQLAKGKEYSTSTVMMFFRGSTPFAGRVSLKS